MLNNLPQESSVVTIACTCNHSCLSETEYEVTCISWNLPTCDKDYPLTEYCIEWLIDFTLSNARWFYSSKGDPLGLKGLKKTISLSPLHPKSTVIMQFVFSVIFVRNFTCLLGTLQTKSMGLIGNSISPEQQRPSFAHCTMHVYNYSIVVSFIHVHVAYYLLTI